MMFRCRNCGIKFFGNLCPCCGTVKSEFQTAIIITKKLNFKNKRIKEMIKNIEDNIKQLKLEFE